MFLPDSRSEQPPQNHPNYLSVWIAFDYGAERSAWLPRSIVGYPCVQISVIFSRAFFLYVDKYKNPFISLNWKASMGIGLMFFDSDKVPISRDDLENKTYWKSVLEYSFYYTWIRFYLFSITDLFVAFVVLILIQIIK